LKVKNELSEQWIKIISCRMSILIFALIQNSWYLE
jgi:hypothetical protein